jgi:hypothetical protein
MAVHAVCETTNLRAVHYAERIWDAVSDIDIDNGTLGYLEDKEDGGVICNFKAGTKKGAQVVLVHMPEWTEDTSRMTNQRKDKFTNVAGRPFRAFTLTKGDEFALSAEGFVGTPEIGKYVSIDDSGKLVVADAPVEGAVMVGKIMRKRQIGSTLVTKVREYGYKRMMYTVKVETLA